MSKIIFVVFFILFFTVACLAQSNHTESLTITTYYPAPSGVYRNLRLNPTIEPTGTAKQPGVMYYDNATDTMKYWAGTVKGWVNITDAGSGDALAYSLHTKSDCTNHVPHGEVVDTDVGMKQCRFGTETNPVSECPSGWTQYKTWSTRAASSCSCGPIWCSSSYYTSNCQTEGKYFKEAV